jgi:hypothetical protein
MDLHHPTNCVRIRSSLELYEKDVIFLELFKL